MMRAILWVPLLVACSPNQDELAPWQWVDVGVQVGAAFDPKLPAATLDIQIDLPDDLPTDCELFVVANHQQGVTTQLWALDAKPMNIEWDGLGPDGLPLDPGEVQISADLDCSDRVQGFGEARTHFVRLGPAEIDLNIQGDQAHVPLAYHRTDVSTRDLNPVPPNLVEWRNNATKKQLSDLDLDDGTPRPSPSPWTVAHSPPWGAGQPSDLSSLNHPAAYVAGGAISVGFVPGTTSTSARSHTAIAAAGPLEGRAALPTIRVVSDELDNADEVGWSPGNPTTFSGAVAPSTLGKHALTLTWRFEALTDGEWQPIPGSLTTSHPLWVTAGPTAVLDGSDEGASPAVTWVGVLADLQPAVQGLPGDDHGAIMDALRTHLHNDPWVNYNPSDSAYSDFEGRYIYWDQIWLDMSGWLDRQDGIDLYCHSVACLLSSQANHLGIEAEYITIVDEAHPDSRRTFRTYLTRAAGTENWRAWTFNSHGIVRYDGLVWDAAVDLDGDEAPASLPASAVQPMGLPFSEYADLLTSHNMIIVNNGRCANY